ncbi:MAG: hypothetical protein SCJ97_02635 [Bacillota bacterium]|nr:hypothetical protein [Bacillota bacterium]
MNLLYELLEKEGPMTGKKVVSSTGLDTFDAWKQCRMDDKIISSLVSTRYLRLDSKVENYARLSPSIMREFLNYTIIGIERDRSDISEMAVRLEAELTLISRKKVELAESTVKRLIEANPAKEDYIDQACFIIAGDVVYGMAHSEPRPESSTGELVRGSDLDIIVVTDNLSEVLTSDLDRMIFGEKYNLLMNPAVKEEIDYLIKDLETVSDQLKFDNFKSMVASKILYEGEYLYGSKKIFRTIGKMLIDSGIPNIIAGLEKNAALERQAAEHQLLKAEETEDRDHLMALFYTTEEKEEIF